MKDDIGKKSEKSEGIYKGFNLILHESRLSNYGKNQRDSSIVCWIERQKDKDKDKDSWRNIALFLSLEVLFTGEEEEDERERNRIGRNEGI